MEIKDLSVLLNQTVVPEIMGTQVNPTAIEAYNATSPAVLVTQQTARQNADFLSYCDTESLDVDYKFALTEDLSNYSDFGKAVEDLTDNDLQTAYQKLLLGIRSIWVRNRLYEKDMPDIYIPYEEYGAVREIVQFGLNDYTEYHGNKLVGGTTYNQDTYHATGEDVKIYENMSTVEVEGSIPYDQLKIYFQDASQMNVFVSGVMTKFDNTMTVALEAIVARIINSMIARSENVVNLVSEYNTVFTNANLTAKTALTDPDFLRWTSTVIKNVKSQMKKYNKIYNDKSIETFTPERSQHLTLLDLFSNNLGAYLYSDTYHDEFVKYSKFDTVPFWQTRGNSLIPQIESVGNINIKFGQDDTVALTNVVGVLYDEFSCGISLSPANVRTHYNAKGDFLNYFFGQKEDNFIDQRAATVVFTLN